MSKLSLYSFFSLIIFFVACSKGSSPEPEPPLPPPPASFGMKSSAIDGVPVSGILYNVSVNPVIKLSFEKPLNKSTVASSIHLATKEGTTVSYTASYENADSIILIQPVASLNNISTYIANITTALKAAEGGSFKTATAINIITRIDSTDKFPRIGDDALLELIQKQTFKYFWDFGHPASGLARERNSSGDVCTTGGTGFGVMSIVAAANRNFVTRTEALQRIQKIVSFYKNNCTAYHGAFAHWVNGATGITVPFSAKDDGADLVETSYLMQGLLCARQYFNTAEAAETILRTDINTLWNAVEWTWFQKSNEDVLYWHWSPNYNWDMNVQIKGWNESLIVYALAASSNTTAITKSVYDNGWAGNGGMQNGNSFYSIQLPLGPSMGGPLFFAHYSFLGINPHELTDAYANYWTQNTAHTEINYNYCITNPVGYYGYSTTCWGLTASDEQNGYSAHAPGNDNGTVSPTAAVSSLPYAPSQSMDAIRYFYYTMGNKLWGEYGFKDAFNLTATWFADSYLAIDQGPMIIMIENYRSGLLWNLFMSCPEVKTGMKQLGFQGPYL
ncbi:hypothetical protein BH10BAC2_BH10BAC2_03260 [soil metagenome]